MSLVFCRMGGRVDEPSFLGRGQQIDSFSMALMKEMVRERGG